MTSVHTLQRPTTMAEIHERIEYFSTKESRQLGLAFQPQASDVFISPYPKSGTTWLQQIVHGLRTRGDMTFGEITEVVPWLEMAADLGLDLHAPQPAPRAFKSHLDWHEIPKGGRYIISVRHPKEALISSYHFLEGWWFIPGSIALASYAEVYFLADRGYWRHLASWWEHRNDPNVLLLSYEDMKENLPRAIRTIAHFIGCELDPALLEIVVRQSSLPFMLAHEAQFDDHLVRNARDPVCGLPPGGNSSKVTGRSQKSHTAEVPQAINEQLETIWQQEIEAKFGLPSYDALRAELMNDKKVVAGP